MLEVKWMKNDDVLDIIGSGGKLAGGTIADPSLVIKDVNEFDAGSYQCKATNAVGSTLGTAIVLGKPYVYALTKLVLVTVQTFHMGVPDNKIFPSVLECLML
jgi:hypothetical protein